jgi:hypothetical protein
MNRNPGRYHSIPQPIDSDAQALQITLKHQGREFACLFRRMGKARPVDWYHAIQKAIWQAEIFSDR